ncbi:hypothetical protein STCU_06645, partial [Strigomonas culicis]
MPSSSASASNPPCQKLVSILQEKYPTHKDHIDRAQRVLQHLITAFCVVSPYAARGWQQLAALRAAFVGADGTVGGLPLSDVLPLFMGLVFCFFGSSFLLLFTVAATVRLVCWDVVRASGAVLLENYRVAWQEHKRDEQRDDDGNGIPDVDEIDTNAYIARKVRVFVKSIDVQQVSTAVQALLAGVMSVVATLRVGFAKRLTLSASLANALAPYLHLAPFLRDHVLAGSELQKLAELLERGMLHGGCFLLSLLLSRFLYMVYCAVRGADLFVFFSLRLAIRQRWIRGEDYGIAVERMEDVVARKRRRTRTPSPPPPPADPTAVAASEDILSTRFTISNFSDPKIKLFLVVVASMGFFFQLAHHDGLPFPFNVVLLPLTIAEGVLSVVLSFLMVL